MCQLVGVSVVPPAMCHIIELYELGSLRDWVENGRELGKEECSSTLFRLQLARSCAQAVEFLYSRSIVISDCKSPNFLVKLDGTCVICDLGSCFVYREAEERESFVGRWRQYSSNWAAPEILDGMMFTYASDCYALATIRASYLVLHIFLIFRSDKRLHHATLLATCLICMEGAWK